MSREEEQPQSRRTIKGRTGEPTPLAIPDRQQTRLPPLQRSEEAIDQGSEAPRKNSSIRYTTPYNTHLVHPPGVPTTNTPVRRLTGPKDVDTHAAIGRQQTHFDEDEDDYDTDYEETTKASEMKNYPAGRRATGPRGSDSTNNYIAGGRRATGPRDAEASGTGRQTNPRDSNIYNTGRQTNPRDPNAYATGRQTTRNIPANQTRDQRRNAPPSTTINKQNYPRNKQAAKTQDFSRQRRAHWLLPVGIGMMAMLALWLLGSNLVTWGTQFYNDIHYGYPRTFQIDAVVTHNHDSTAHPSHFIALNINRQAIVFEMMAGDPQKAITYVAPVVIAGPNGDRAPITVEFRDVTGDHLPDMILHIHLPTQDQISIFVNDGSKFRPSSNNDKIHL